MRAGLSIIVGISLISIIIIVAGSGCANIIPPSGGAKDTIPPRLFTALPRDSAKNVNTNKIVLTFNEYIEVKDVQQNVIVSPNPKSFPLFDYKLNTVTIKLKDSLEPNTTYSFNFGNSLKDINEGNIARNFTYLFSTGNTIDDNIFSGKVLVAETGKIDSTLIVVLHKNLNDSAISKNRPRYFAKVNSKGEFIFKNLPQGVFAAYVVSDFFNKQYTDSTKLFAFLDSNISVSKKTPSVTFYAFEEAKAKGKTSSSQIPSAARNLKTDIRLRITGNLDNGKQDLLNDSLQLSFNRKIKKIDSSKIVLTDTNYARVNTYKLFFDTSKNRISIINKWKEEKEFKLIIPKDAVIDTANLSLTKADTIRFFTKSQSEYGGIHLRFNNLDTSKSPVLLILQNDKIIESIPIKQKNIDRDLYYPGEYDLRILFDKNKNGIWDSGNFKKKIQPEIVIQLSKKLNVRANFNDTETEITL